jgi:hypothetical protein
MDPLRGPGTAAPGHGRTIADVRMGREGQQLPAEAQLGRLRFRPEVAVAARPHPTAGLFTAGEAAQERAIDTQEVFPLSEKIRGPAITFLRWFGRWPGHPRDAGGGEARVSGGFVVQRGRATATIDSGRDQMRTCAAVRTFTGPAAETSTLRSRPGGCRLQQRGRAVVASAILWGVYGNTWRRKPRLPIFRKTFSGRSMSGLRSGVPSSGRATRLRRPPCGGRAQPGLSFPLSGHWILAMPILAWER